jgi:hypothetical protein
MNVTNHVAPLLNYNKFDQKNVALVIEPKTSTKRWASRLRFVSFNYSPVNELTTCMEKMSILEIIYNSLFFMCNRYIIN